MVRKALLVMLILFSFTAWGCVQEAPGQETPVDHEDGVAKITFDLNGDGEEDIVSLQLLEAADGGFDEYLLRVNDATFRGLADNIEPQFNIVDIDSTDRYKEIAVSEYGPSSDHATTFYYYNGEEIILMGKIEGVYGDDWGDMTIDGSGVIVTRTRGAILQTWFYQDKYMLSDDHLLVNIPQDLYEMNTPVEVLQKIDLQRSRTDTATSFTLTVGEKATIVSSDNQEWCSVQNSKGETGWFAVDGYDTIRSLDLPAYEVFDGLCYAD